MASRTLRRPGGDALGRMESEELRFDGSNGPTYFGTRRHLYAAAGRLEQYTDRNSRVIKYVRDNVGRVIEERWLEGTADTLAYRYVYDDSGRLTEIEAQDGGIWFADFDAQRRPGNVIVDVDAEGDVFSYALDYDYRDRVGSSGTPAGSAPRSGCEGYHRSSHTDY